MAHTQDAVVYDLATGQVLMRVIPDDDAQLAMIAFAPPGSAQVLVPHTDGVDPLATAITLYPQLNLTMAAISADQSSAGQ